MKFALFALLLCGCYAEWDVPAMKRRDPCTRVIEDKVVYVMPVCRYPAQVQR